MEKNKEISIFKEEESSINIKEIVFPYLKYWYVFIITAIVALIIAFFYLKYSVKEYSASAKILINDKGSKNLTLAALDNSILKQEGDSELIDLIEIIKSRRIIAKVVERLQLNVTFKKIGRIKEVDVFGSEVPISVKFLNSQDNLNHNLKGNYKIIINSLSDFYLIDNKTNNQKKYRFGELIKGNSGDFVIYPASPEKLKREIDSEYLMNFTSINSAVNYYKSKIQIAKPLENSRILNITLVDNIKSRAIVVIDELIKDFSNDLKSDDLKLTEATSEFINERLQIVSGELRGVDKNLESYKSSNKITDLSTESDLFLSNSVETDKKILDSYTQLSLIDFMNKSLLENSNQLLPSNIGLQDATITSTIEKYNNLLLAKEDKLKNVTEKHDDVLKIQQQINELKYNLIESFKVYKKNIQTVTSSLQTKQNNINNQLAKIPNKERVFKDISRQQQIVEALYLFLLQKREESEIKGASNPEHIKVVDSAFASNTPVSPKSNIIYLGSLIIGLVIPFGFIYLKQLLNNKVQSKEDIEKSLKISVAAQIPHTTDNFIKSNDTSVVAEAFRMLRTNINFFIDNSIKNKVIFVTSTISGEGKTFISCNLSQILSFSSENVLLIGADIRNPKLLSVLDINNLKSIEKGLTNYLVGDITSVEDIIIKKPTGFKFDIISSGPIPPNPAELLMNGRFEKLIEAVKEKYDYIIVDTAPISLVTDTVIIADQADLTLYLTRIDYTDKNILEIPKQLHKDNILKNMSLVINDVSLNNAYGYRYNYGYGYNYGKNKKLKWYQKLLKIIRK